MAAGACLGSEMESDEGGEASREYAHQQRNEGGGPNAAMVGGVRTWRGSASMIDSVGTSGDGHLVREVSGVVDA